MNYISKNIRHLVGYEKLSQDDFGILFGLNVGQIGSYIRGGVAPSIKLLLAISTKYEISLDDLVGKDLSKNTYLLDKENYVNETEVAYSTISKIEKEKTALAKENDALMKQILLLEAERQAQKELLMVKERISILEKALKIKKDS